MQWEKKMDRGDKVAPRAASVAEGVPVLISGSICAHPHSESPFSCETSGSQFLATTTYLEGLTLTTFLRRWKLNCIVSLFVQMGQNCRFPGARHSPYYPLLSRHPQRSLCVLCF